MKRATFLMAAACMALLTGCATPEPPPPPPVMQAMDDSVVRDPDNAQFMRAITEYVRAESAPENSRYEFTRVDLNGDGRREGIVMMKAPHQYWCGVNGCSMAIFKAENDGFELLSEVAPVRGPLLVSDSTTGGWKDIIVRVSGRMDARSKNVALQFDGSGYPSQPAFQPQLRYAWNDFAGIRIFP